MTIILMLYKIIAFETSIMFLNIYFVTLWAKVQ